MRRRDPRLPKRFARALALALGLAAGLGTVELALRVAGLPEFHRAHTTPSQFDFVQSKQTGKVFFVNKAASAITFEYDSDPRGYFGPGNRVVHQTNARGFRGPDCSAEKPPNTVRLVFLGDSFTFGEGVRFEDTFAEATARRLAGRFSGTHLRFESCNLGVSGYNTADALYLVDTIVPALQPDVVILGYVINDAEPALFSIDPLRGPVRRPREAAIAEGIALPTPPDTGLYQTRIAQLLWRFQSERARGAQTEGYYQSLYGEDAEGWKIAREALGEIALTCQREQIPSVVVLFPVLHRLSPDHPFQDIYRRVQQSVEGTGGEFLSLFPAYLGADAESLWVHPTDQHPNEIAHRIAAEQIEARLASYPDFVERVEAASTSSAPTEPAQRIP